MELTALQILGIAIVAGIGAWASNIAFIPLPFREPIIVGPLVGLVLGDINSGLVVGATFEMVWLGLTRIGGAVPPDKIIGTAIGTVFVVLAGLTPEEALAIALPAALIGQGLGIIAQTINTFFAHWADRFAEKDNPGGITLTLWLGNLVLLLVEVIPVTLALWLGTNAIQRLIAVIPEWLTHDIGVAGSLLPAVGLAMLLFMIMRGGLWAWFVVGFLLAAKLGLDPLTIALFGVAAAVLIYLSKRQAPQVPSQ